MKTELTPIEISHMPELLRIAEEVRTTGQPRLLHGESDDLTVEIRLKPKTTKRAPRILRGKPTTSDDPLWNIVGIGRSEGPTDVASNKYKYLAEGYFRLHYTRPEGKRPT